MRKGVENTKGTFYLSPMTHALLSSRPSRGRSHLRSSSLSVFKDVALRVGRVHELCGPARRTLAAIIASRTTGPVFWITPSWQTDHLHLPAIARFFNPGRLTMLHPDRVNEFLWTMETTLRDGAVPLVIGDFHAPVELTPVRRLHLAAEAALEERMRHVIGLLLTPGDGGSPGVETRWHLSGRHGTDGHRWHLERRRARMEPPKAWELKPGWDLQPARLEPQQAQ